jgi:hypothetical protein
LFLHRAPQSRPGSGGTSIGFGNWKEKRTGHGSSIERIIYKISIAFEVLQMKLTTEMPFFS